MTISRWDRYADVAQARTAAKISTVADARRLAFRRVPRAVFDYIDGGAGAELLECVDNAGTTCLLGTCRVIAN